MHADKKPKDKKKRKAVGLLVKWRRYWVHRAGK
jgi:hypothetical protein